MSQMQPAWYRVHNVTPTANPLQKAVQLTVNTTARLVNAVKGFSLNFANRLASGYSLLLGRTRFDYQSDVGDATRNSIVVATVGWVARNFPEAPVRIKLLGGKTAVVVAPAFSGPGALLRLLERPNPYYSGVLLWMATVVDVFTSGNGYWVKQRAPNNDRVVGLWWVPSTMLRPRWPESDPTVFISHYEYNVDGALYRIPISEVVHFREGIDPHNTRVGRSRLASLFREIFTDDEAANMTASLMANLGVPGVIIAPANTAGAQARITEPDKVKQSFMEKFGGDRRGEPMVMTSATDIKVLSWSPQQMNLRELRRIPEERISAVLGVSAIVAGLGAGLDRSTFSNFAEARKAAYQESIVPLQRLMAAEIEVQLLDDFVDITNYDVDFDLTNVTALQEDWNAVWRRAQSAAQAGLITVQDFQRAVGQPVDAGRDIYLRTSGTLEVVRGTPAPEVASLIEQVKSGLITHDEARQLMGLPPMQWSDNPTDEEIIDRLKAGILGVDEARDMMKLPPMEWADGPHPDEVTSLVEQIKAGLITHDEARAVLKRPPMEWADGPSEEEVTTIKTQLEAGLLTHDEARAALKRPPIVWEEGPTTEELTSLIDQAKAGLITYDEARARMGLPPIEYGTDLTLDEVNTVKAQIEAGLLSNDEAREQLGRPPIIWPEDLSDKVTQAGDLIRAGFDPVDVMRHLGLPPIRHLGLPPVTVQKIADAGGVEPMPAEVKP